jgi:hypothetical protein
MQACLENTTLPLLESVPAWTIRVARPTTTGRDELAQDLRGVPKAALRHVFGNVLGTRLWHQHRAAPTSAKPALVAAASASALAAGVYANAAPLTDANASSTAAAKNSIKAERVPDAEISSGMLHYLCAEAAATLRERKCLARSIALTALYSDGESVTAREPLPLAADDSTALETAARLALRSMRGNAFVSIKLDLTATAIHP